jgi:hypothetical protein
MLVLSDPAVPLTLELGLCANGCGPIRDHSHVLTNRKHELQRNKFTLNLKNPNKNRLT